jgi:hypothetical protein
MKRFTFSFVLFGVLSLCFALNAFAQSQTFSDTNVDYTFDIPDTGWKMTTKPTADSPKVEYTYGDRLDGYFEIRKVSVKETDLIPDIIQRDKEGTLQFLPGYVAGTEDVFAGTLKGKVFNYEFVKFGKTMSGRFYYLKADPTMVYVLRFTGLKDKLRLIRNQADSIARTFKIKS